MDKKYLLLVMVGVATIAVTGFFTMQAIQADSLRQQLIVAKESFNNGDVEESIELFKSVLELAPNNTEARIGLVNAYIALSLFDEAIATLNKGIELKPKETQFYHYLSIVYHSLDDLALILESLESGIAATGSSQLEEQYEQLVSSVQINLDRHYVQLDYSRSLSFIWEKSEGVTIPIEAEWKLSDKSMGEIINSNETAIEFTGQQSGKVIVSATVGPVTKEVELFVEDQVIEKMNIFPSEIAPLWIGQEINLSVSGLDMSGEEMELTPAWSSIEQIIEFSSPTGQHTSLTALNEGITTVTIEYQELETEIEIIVQGDNKSVETEVQGEGSILISPEAESYPIGTEILVEAQPMDGWEFVRWEGDISGVMNPATVVIEDSLSIVAVFEQSQTHELTLSILGEGNIIRDSLDATYEHMDSIVLTARPEPGWSFERWEGSVAGTTSEITVLMDNSKDIKAVFTKDIVSEDTETPVEPSQPETDPTYNLSTNVSGSGTIQKNNSGNSFTKGTTIILTAVPSKGWKFVRWEGNAKGTSSSASVVMDGNKSIRAVFEEQPPPPPEKYTLTTSVQGEGVVSPSGGSFNEGETVVLNASPSEEGWSFSRWEGDLTGNNAKTTITMDKKKSVIAVFVKIDEE